MEKSSFFNSVGGDRKYNAADWAAYFASFIGNGVSAKPDDCLKVLPGDNVSVAVSPGAGWINGYYYVNTSKLILELPTPDGALPRIDLIVLHWSLSGRWIKAMVKPGIPASKPVPRSLQRDGDSYELALAEVYVVAGATSIAVQMITDWRKNSTLCGLSSSILSDGHTHESATQAKAGFLSVADKKALDDVVAKVTQGISDAHTHESATQAKAGFLSVADKKALDDVVNKVTQDISTTASVTFKTVTADKVVGAVYA